MKVTKDNCCGVVIDIQEKLFPHIFDNELIGINCCILIRGLSIFNIPILFTEQYSRGLGTTITNLKSCYENYNPIEKISFSCWGSSKFINRIEEFNKKYIIICGIETHVCVQQTVLDLLQEGYKPVVIEDCVSSRKLGDKITAIDRMRTEGAIITSYESILFELCEKADNPEFKSISHLIK